MMMMMKEEKGSESDRSLCWDLSLADLYLYICELVIIIKWSEIKEKRTKRHARDEELFQGI